MLDMTDLSTRVDLAPTGLNAANFPAQPWLLAVNYIGGFNSSGNYVGSNGAGGQIPGADNAKHIGGSKTVMVHELAYQVQGVVATRWRRSFVAHTYIDAAMKPILIAALPSSTASGGDGARDLFYTPTGGTDIQFSWPLEVVRDNGVFAVMIDRSRYGLNSYTPTNAYDPIIDDIAGIDAARWFINNAPLFKSYPGACQLRLPLMKNILVGGLSYGSISATFLAGALKDAEAVYMAGAYPAKAGMIYYPPAPPGNPPDFFPADWMSPSRDYIDMLKASNAKKVMFTWGPDLPPPAGDYANNGVFSPININVAKALKTYDPSRFDYAVLTPNVQGHEINLPHLRSWFTARVAALSTAAGDRGFSIPTY